MRGVIHDEKVSRSIRLLTLDNPPMNAMGVAMREVFTGVLDEVDADQDLRVLVLTGKGKAFCAGDDLKDVHEGSKNLDGFRRLVERLDSCRVPIIAAINGWCIGGGFELALACDIRLASREAKFTAAGVNVGLMASTWRLPRLIGVSRAKAMLLTGLPHDAATAERYGVVTGVYAPEDLQAAALALAERIATRAPLSVEATKRVSARAPDLNADDAAAVAAAELHVLRSSADHREAVAAFQQKRDPVFTRS